MNGAKALDGPPLPNSTRPNLQGEIKGHEPKCKAFCRPAVRIDASREQKRRENSVWEMLNVQEQLESLEQMTEQPSVEKFIFVSQKCRKKKNLTDAKRLHMYICNNGMEAHKALGNYLVPMFVECGSVSDAQEVFNRLVYRNEYAWTSLIQGYIERGELQHALSLYQKMQENFVHPSKHTFVAVLKACAKEKCVKRGQEIHADIAKEKCETDAFVGSALVDMYAKCGSLAEAKEVLHQLPVSDVFSWTALITGYADRGLGEEALNCFQQMQVEGVSPDAVTFVCSLKACGSLRAIEKGREIESKITKHGFQKDLAIGNTLVDMYVKCGSIVAAREVFDKMPVRDVVSWNALITGYCEHGCCEEALKCFQQMQLDGVPPTAVTFISSLRACGGIGALDRGRQIHAAVVKQGCESDLFVSSTLVEMYAKCCSLAEARDVFDELPIRDVVLWTALITRYAEQGLAEEALKCLEQMQLESVQPDAATLICSLKACGSIRAIDKGREIHAYVVKKELERNSIVGSALADMYSKCGFLVEAQEMFDKLQNQDLVSWTALISAYTEHVLFEEALSCLEQMQLVGLSPDAITFVCSLKACSCIGAIERGREIHTGIVKLGFERDPSIGNSLVEMYAKCGIFAEAQEEFSKLAVRDVASWNALIVECSEHSGLGEEVLNCFQQMQLEDVCADAVTFVSSLKACISIGAVEWGHKIHAEIVKLGYEKDPFVANCVVDMYIKCAPLIEAHEVFDMLQVQDVVLWTALIGGYAEHGHADKALQCFRQMQVEGVCPNAVTFICSLKSCGSIGAIGTGQEIHAEIVKEGYERDPVVGNSLLGMYAKCGSLEEGLEVFDKLPVQNVVSWTSVIGGYAEHALPEQAMNFFQQMQLVGTSPDAVLFTCALKACCSIQDIDRCQVIYAEITKAGYESDCFVGSTLVEMYAKCGLFVEAWEVLGKLPIQDIVSWNVLIAGYAEHRLDEEVVSCFQQMQLEGISPDAVTFVWNLKACGSMGDIDRGRQIHDETGKHGLEKNIFVGSALVDMYAKCGLLVEAQELFDNQQVRDVVLWTALIAGYAEHGHGEEALKCLKQMQLEGVPPDAVTFVCSLKACSSMGDMERGREMHADITKQGFDRDPFVCSTLVDLYAKCGSLAEAWEMFDKLPARDVVAWTALIASCSEHGLGMEAMNCLKQMQLEGMSPDSVTFICTLKSCCSTGAVDQVREIHAEIARQGFERDSSVGSTLVDVYGKCGSLAEACDVFDKLLAKDVVSWTALIAGHAEHGLGEEAKQCFQQMESEGVPPDVASWNALILGHAEQGEVDKAFKLYTEMQEQGMPPNNVTFVGILKACGNMASLDTGKMIHVQICQVGGMELTTALIDMYSKCGSMVDAQQVFDAMPTRNLVAWNALITGYARQGECDFIFQLFERMREDGVQPDGITFLSILTVCSHAGLVDKGQNFFKAMNKDYGIALTIMHHNCMIDLLGRAGQLDEVMAMLEKMPFQPDSVVWSTVLGACQKWGNVDLGRQAFECAMNLNGIDAAAFIAMSNIYADAQI